MKYQIQSLITDLVKSRKRLGLSQSEIGEKLSFPQSYISSIEHCKRDIRMSTFLEISRILRLEVVLVPNELTATVRRIIDEFNGDEEAEENRPAFLPTPDDD